MATHGKDVHVDSYFPPPFRFHFTPVLLNYYFLNSDPFQAPPLQHWCVLITADSSFLVLGIYDYYFNLQ